MTRVPSTLATASVWILFFAASAYGHVALKLAVDARPKLGDAVVSATALSAYAAWALSALLWAVVLSRHSLFGANAISALRYVAVAASAVLLLKEPLSTRHVVGGLLIGAGVLVLGRGG